MDMKILKFSFILVCVLISCGLFGCKHDGIKFYRESGVQQFVQSIQQGDNTSVKRSSGVVIYKDNSTHDVSGGSAKFGPKDLNFDINIK